MNRNLEDFGVAAYDIATRDKIPVIKRLMPDCDDGLGLDIGIGTGYTTRAVFGNRPTVCVDLHAPNLEYYRRIDSQDTSANALCVVARATELPFLDGVFAFTLCSEVLEHLEDDERAAAEIARVLSPAGTAVITVPYTGLSFIGFLELCGIKTVHDFPGPEQHVRPGYDERSLGALLGRHGLAIVRHDYFLRLVTKLLVDMVSLCHLVYQRVVHRRNAWTWSEAAAAEGSLAFRIYRRAFPLIFAISRLDKLLSWFRGFGLVAAVRKPGARPSRHRPA